MIHFNTSIAAAAILLAAPGIATAETSAPTTFHNQGVEYSYTTETTGNEQIVRGTAYAGSVPFELHIKKKVVEGTFNHQPVTFSFDQVKKLGLIPDAK